MFFSDKKKNNMYQLCNDDKVIEALAIDQRVLLENMFKEFGVQNAINEKISRFKEIVSEELTPYTSSILLDTETGLKGAEIRSADNGLMLAYEKSGFGKSAQERFPQIIDKLSVQRLKAHGANACKFLLHYDIDQIDESVNDKKKVYIERIGSECKAENMPFFLEVLAYDSTGKTNSAEDFARQKPAKVLGMLKEFSKSVYGVDVLKVEAPVDMKFVEGFSNERAVYSRNEAAEYFKEQSEIIKVPYIFLSAGVSSKLFRETLSFAKDSGADFNGVLCGRATWSGAVKEFALNGEEAARQWLREEGTINIKKLNAVLKKTATPLNI